MLFLSACQSVTDAVLMYNRGKKGKKRRTSIYIWPLSVLSQPTAIKKYFLLRRRRRSSSVQRTEKYITGQRPASFFFFFFFFSLSTAYCTTNRAETSSSFHLDLFFFSRLTSAKTSTRWFKNRKCWSNLLFLGFFFLSFFLIPFLKTKLD